VAPLRRALIFIGFMGAGKTTVAHEVAAALGEQAQDADRLLEEELGESIADVFDREGEPAFRAREEQVTGELLERADGGVIALGGGALGSERVRAALARHVAVLVDVDEGTAWARAAGRGRPLARDRAAFRALHRERAAAYERAAGAILLSGDRSAGRRAAPVLRALAAGEVPAGVVEVPAGEEHKTLGTAERVWRALATQGVRRGDHLVAVGGGVIGDLAGFCAATYQRGIPVVQVPTTLVAQVDSAYGGKTGVDLPEAKNYVGAYHQPAGVIADTGTLDTLPAAELAAGYAEVVKTALIAGGALWDRVASGDPVDDAVITACALAKLRVVAADERDEGLRQVLNLGHTVGHALETVTGYARLRHGEAVGLGLLAALRLSGREDLRGRVAGLLAAASLPVSIDGIDPDDVLAATARDKKRTGAEPVGFVLCDAPGEVRFGVPVSAGDVRAAIAELAT
jgi:shikimate kinase/3-dehydroquinate synthase